MYLERLWLLRLHLIRCLFSSHTRKPVMGTLQRERQDELLGLLKSCQKPFLSMLCPPRYSSCQLKSEDGKNFWLEKNFSTSERNLGTGLSIWKNPETVGMEGTYRLRGTLKNQDTTFWKIEMNMALSSVEKRNQTATVCVGPGMHPQP